MTEEEQTVSTLTRLLSLEREKRIAAERLVETERQALLQLKSSRFYDDKNTTNGDNITRSFSNSSGISSPLPRAFSQEFYETLLHELPDDVQSTLSISPADSINSVTSSPFTRASYAIEHNNPKLLNQILQEDRQGGNLTIVKYGTQLLNTAIETGSVGCLRLLLEEGCSPNESGLSALPPLHLAVINGHTSCLKALLGYGAEIDLSDAKGCSPMYTALKNSQLDCVDALLKAKPNLTSVTSFGQSLLHAAVLCNVESVLRSLLVEMRTNGPLVADIINRQDQDGYTALHLASSNSCKSCVEILCACPEVDTSLTCSKGNTPLDLCTNEECRHILSTKTYKEARVVVLTGEANRSQYAVGQIRVLAHHDWNDLCWLIKGSLQEYDHVLNDRMEPMYRESQTYLSHHSQQRHQSSLMKNELYYLTQMDSDKLAQEMKTVITARQNTIHSIKTQSYIDHCTIGNYKPSDSEVVSPYKALSVMEEKGEICQVSVHLKSGLERIGFVSLNPLSTLNDYTNLLIKNKCVIMHGPPETDLSVLLGQISASLKAVSSLRIEKIHLPLSSNFTHVHAIGLLYDNGLLQLDGEDFTTMAGCSLLVMEGIDKLDQYDSLIQLAMLLRQYESEEGVWLDVSGDQSSVPPGKYRLIRQCYVIATRTLYNSTSSLPREVMDSYAHIWLSDSEEPMVGFLLRNYIRDLIDTKKGTLPTKSDHVYQALIWVWQFWLLFNHYMHQLDLFHLTIGPKLFLNCPVQSNNADNIYNWFAELWSFHLIPKLKDTFLTPSSNSKGNKQHKSTATSKSNTFKHMLFFLVHRLIETTCPLPSEATGEFVSALQESHDISGIVIKDTSGKDNGVGTKMIAAGKSPKNPDRRGSLKKANTIENNKDASNKSSDEIPLVAVHKRYPSSDGLLPPQPTADVEKLHVSSKVVQRPKSGGLFSKNSNLRKSLFKGSKTSLYALEEEEQKSKKKKKKKKQEEENEREDNSGKDIEQLFDVLFTTSSHRLDEQRATSPPHHIITVTTSPHTSPPLTTPSDHSPTHSLTDKLEPLLRPLSADSMSRSSEHVPNSTAGGIIGSRKTHPRISNLLEETHTLPRLRSRSEDNVYLTTNLSSDGSGGMLGVVSQTSLPHSHQVSMSSDALSDSLERQTSTESSLNSSLNNSMNFDSQLEQTSLPPSKETAKEVEQVVTKEAHNVAKEEDGVPKKAVSLDESGVSPSLSRKHSKSYQVLYSASLGFCSSFPPPSRKTSVPVVTSSSATTNGPLLRPTRNSTTSYDWLTETTVEM